MGEKPVVSKNTNCLLIVECIFECVGVASQLDYRPLTPHKKVLSYDTGIATIIYFVHSIIAIAQ